jgi:uncharacterized protein involved in exopolysaccharide biosynthesis
MPSPYELPMRWLEWHERWPVPEIESLKRQIETVKLEIAILETEPDLNNDRIVALREVLATLERLMPPF